MKTAGVKALVEAVLETMPRPYSEHVIDEVFGLIEHTPRWRAEYDALCEKLGRESTNNAVGHWVAAALEKTGKKQVPGTRSSLNGSYSILDTDMSLMRKPTEEQALQRMSEYYMANRSSLPATIRDHRDEIVALIMAGRPVADAFAMVLGSPDGAR
jgi:hypothetical protein